MPAKGATESEREMPSKGDGFHRITNVSRPTVGYSCAAEGRAGTGDDCCPVRL